MLLLPLLSKDPAPHGKRASSAVKTEELRQIGDGPSGLFALDFHGVFAGIPP
jgi:hypothetical protein